MRCGQGRLPFAAMEVRLRPSRARDCRNCRLPKVSAVTHENGHGEGSDRRLLRDARALVACDPWPPGPEKKSRRQSPTIWTCSVPSCTVSRTTRRSIVGGCSACSREVRRRDRTQAHEHQRRASRAGLPRHRRIQAVSELPAPASGRGRRSSCREFASSDLVRLVSEEVERPAAPPDVPDVLASLVDPPARASSPRSTREGPWKRQLAGPVLTVDYLRQMSEPSAGASWATLMSEGRFDLAQRDHVAAGSMETARPAAHPPPCRRHHSEGLVARQGPEAPESFKTEKRTVRGVIATRTSPVASTATSRARSQVPGPESST